MDWFTFAFLVIAVIWVASQGLGRNPLKGYPRWLPLLAACLIVVIVAFDSQLILGHPGGFGRTIVKLALSLGLVIAVASGLTSIYRFRTLFSVVWAVLLNIFVLWVFSRTTGG